MRIKTKITLWMTAVVTLVVAAIAGNLIIVERQRVRAEFDGRADALLEGVSRIARESVATQDELMLLSYLKFLMRDYPAIELAVIRRRGHASTLGAEGNALLYRNVTVTGRRAAEFRPAEPAVPAAAGAGEVQEDLPPDTLSIRLGLSKAALERQIREAQALVARKVLAIASLGLILGVAGSMWLGQALSRPLAGLAEAAERLGSGDLDVEVVSSSRDEFGYLAGRFNEMAKRLGDTLRFKEDLLSTLTHELNTPLGGVKGFLEHLQTEGRDRDPAERSLAYRTMSEAVGQMEISLGNAIQFFRTEAVPALQPESLSVRDLLQEVLGLFGPVARSGQIALEGPAGGEGRISGDREMLRRICINLVSNALKFTPPGGRVGIELEDEAGALHLRVSDTGPGIAPEDRERIFTKFYRAPGPGGRPQRIPGSGLGLAIAKRAVDLHGGRIWVEAGPRGGSVFHVVIPIKQGAGS